MTERQGECCEQMRAVLDGAESALVYVAKFREYGIKVLDGGSSFVVIAHCPWCGSALPETLRDRWFDEIEALGLSFPEDEEEIPTEFADDTWYKSRGL